MAETSVKAPTPRVLLVIPDHWPRSLLRAALLEVGYDAVGASSVEEALDYPADVSDRGPVRLILASSDVLRTEATLLQQLLRKHRDPIAVLLAPATVAKPEEGSWHKVLRRPQSIGALVREIQSLLPFTEAGPVPD